MNVVRMKDKGKDHNMGLKDPFSDASAPDTDNLLELVKLLARIAADNDYNELLGESKPSYTGPKKKGPK